MRPIVEIIRLDDDFTFGTFGVLKIQKEVFCMTLEPPDLLNLRNKSSIPAQQYVCRRILSPKFGKTFEVMDVPGRTSILFHPGNFVEHTEGCILLAEHIGKLKGQRAVLNSGETFKAFMWEMENETEFHLTIREVY